MLFIDYSSTFNIIIPSRLITKFGNLHISISLCSWILTCSWAIAVTFFSSSLGRTCVLSVWGLGSWQSLAYTDKKIIWLEIQRNPNFNIPTNKLLLPMFIHGHYPQIFGTFFFVYSDLMQEQQYSNFLLSDFPQVHLTITEFKNRKDEDVDGFKRTVALWYLKNNYTSFR